MSAYHVATCVQFFSTQLVKLAISAETYVGNGQTSCVSATYAIGYFLLCIISIKRAERV